MRVVYLILATVALIFMIIMFKRGERYEEMLVALDEEEFPLNGMYLLGFAMSEIPFLRLRGKLKKDFMSQAMLIYDARYGEFYASVVWAQVLSFAFVGIAAGLALAGLMNSGLMLVIGLAVGVVFAGYFFTKMKETLNTRATECTAELPEIVTTMALLINAGMMLRNAWKTIAEKKQGVIYDLMRISCDDMDNGMAEVDAIHKFGRYTNSPEVRKFTSALNQSIERGGGDLSDFLSRQSTEMWALKKQIMLQKGEAAASKLLAPTAMLFVAIIVAVMTGAIGMLF